MKAIEQFVQLCDALELLPGDILDCDSAYYPSRLKMLDATFWGVDAAAMKQGLEIPKKGVEALDDAAV